MTVADAVPGKGRPRRGGVVGWLSKVFAVNPAGLNWPRGVMLLDVMLVPMFVFWAIGHEEYLLSALFGALVTVVADPGGAYGRRASHLAIYALAGAALTALAFGIGGSGWGWLVLAAFGVTVVATLAVMFGVHRFVAALLLNVWFIVALSTAFSLHHHTQITNHTWAQVVAWAGGSALWIAVTFIEWLIRGRQDQPQPVAEIPGDTSRRPLTAPLVAFAVIRGLAMAGSAAIAYGLNLPYADWLPIATIAAMKPDLGQSTVVAGQRVAGALMGAVAAGLLLLAPVNQHGLRLLAIDHGLEVVAIVLVMHAVAIRVWNYAFYSGAVAAAVLILVDIPKPSNYAAEGDRVLWTLGGVVIAVVVMFLADLLAKRAARKSPQPAS